jgi:hypothetical protein
MPVPAPAPSTPDVGQTWAQQQIQNLLNPSSAGQQTPAPAPPAAAPVPGLPSAQPSPEQTSAPSTAPGAPAGPQPNAPGDLIDQTRQSAVSAGIDPDIFTRQIKQESNFNPNAGSPAGAQGIAQFMPETARGLGIDPSNPQQALPAAANLMKSYLDKYGGDWSKALSAYNAGPGNVDKYGGIPPFEETQTYVKNILGGAGQALGNAAQTGLSAVNTAVQGVQSAVARTSQFGLGLSSGDAMAFCGPTAALAFAQSFGRNPTVAEAKQLAQQVGWNPDQGMAGPQSEVQLLKTMGVDAHMTAGVDWAQVGRDASGGNPVILDSPGHYWYVDGYNQQTGQLHVGTSGTDLKGGSEWMTPDQINGSGMGSVRAAIFADHPLAQSDGLAQSTSRLTMGTMQPGSSDQPDLGSSIGLAVGNAPLPFLGGQSISDIGNLLGQNSQQLQQGRDLVGNILAPTASGLQTKANSILQAVQDVGSSASKAGQDLLTQGQNVLGNVQSDLSQAPTTIQGILQQNALTSQGIPNIGGQALEGAGNLMSGIGGAVNAAATDPNAGPIGLTRSALQTGMQGLASNVENDPTLFGAGVRGAISAYQSPLRQQLLPNITDPEHPVNVMRDLQQKYGTSMPDDRMTPEDRDRAENLMMAIGGMEQPTLPNFEQAAGPQGMQRVLQAVRDYHVGNVIASPATLAHVALTSAISPLWSLGSRGIEDLATFQPSRIAGSVLGAQVGLQGFAGDLLEGLNAVYSRPTALPGVMGRIWQTPAALHSMLQTAAGNAIVDQELGRLASQQATKEGLQGGQWIARTRDLITDPLVGWKDTAQGVANRATLRGDLGTLGQWFATVAGQGDIGGTGGTARQAFGNVLAPVFRIGMNSLTQLTERSPLGLAGTAFDVARGAAGVGPYAGGQFARPVSSAVTPLGERLANNLIGTALSVWLAGKAVDGTVTGEGPDDPEQAATLRAQGWQPHSLNLAGQYVDYSHLPPAMQGPLRAAGAYADAVEAAKQANRPLSTQSPLGAAAASLFHTVGTTFADDTPLRTLSDIYQLFKDPTQAPSIASTTLANMVGSYVPMSAAVRGATIAADPNARKPNALFPGSFGQALEQNLPGLRGNVPIAQDVLGRQQQNPQQGLGALLPSIGKGTPSPVAGAFAESGMGIAQPPPTVAWNGREIRLTPDEKQTYQRIAGERLQVVAGKMLESPAWQALQARVDAGDERARAIMQTRLDPLVQQAHQYAETQVIRGMSPADRAARAQFTRGPLATVIGYQPEALSQQANLAQHRALINSLLGAG